MDMPLVQQSLGICPAALPVSYIESSPSLLLYLLHSVLQIPPNVLANRAAGSASLLSRSRDLANIRHGAFSCGRTTPIWDEGLAACYMTPTTLSFETENANANTILIPI